MESDHIRGDQRGRTNDDRLRVPGKRHSRDGPLHWTDRNVDAESRPFRKVCAVDEGISHGLRKENASVLGDEASAVHDPKHIRGTSAVESTDRPTSTPRRRGPVWGGGCGGRLDRRCTFSKADSSPASKRETQSFLQEGMLQSAVAPLRLQFRLQTLARVLAGCPLPEVAAHYVRRAEHPTPREGDIPKYLWLGSAVRRRARSAVETSAP